MPLSAGTRIGYYEIVRVAGTNYATFLRRVDQTEAVRLGDGVNASSYNVIPISPDGARLAMIGPDGHHYLHSFRGEREPLRGARDDERVIRWSGDGRASWQLVLRRELVVWRGRYTPGHDAVPQNHGRRGGR